MKILFLVGSTECQLPTDELGPGTIKSTATVYNYFLRKELGRHAGIETESYPFRKVTDEARTADYLRALDPPPADHVICLEQRGFAAANRKVFDFYKARTPGAVCAICDHDKVLGPEDYLFHVQLSTRMPPSPTTRHVTWAADPAFCYPEKEPGVLNILVDHHNYSGGDKVREIRAGLQRFLSDVFPKWGPRLGFEKVVVRQFVSRGLAEIDPFAPYVPEAYDRKGIPFPDACREYRRANIFMVTKPESMGLSMIECAMSGTFVVAPRGFANPYLLDPLNHLFWDEEIPWDKVMALLDVPASVEAAAPFNWQRLSHLMLTTLREHGTTSVRSSERPAERLPERIAS